MSANTAGTLVSKELKDHRLVPETTRIELVDGVIFEKQPVKGKDGRFLTIMQADTYAIIDIFRSNFG